MLVHKLLLAFVFNNNGKIVKASYQATNLEAIHQIDNNTQVFLTNMV